MADLTQKKAEVLALLGELLSMKASEEREAEINLALKRLCPDPYWSDYVFHSREFEKQMEALILRRSLIKYSTTNPFSYSSRASARRSVRLR